MGYVLVQIKNSQLTCMANRDLTRRVKHMSSDAYPYHKDVVCNDIQLACQLIKHLDCKHHLFEPDSQVCTIMYGNVVIC